MINDNQCAFEACHEGRNKSAELCVGEGFALYVYTLKQEREQIMNVYACLVIL